MSGHRIPRSDALRRGGLRPAVLAPALCLLTHLLGAQTAPPAIAVPVPFTLSGEVRTRGEWERTGSALPNDAFTFLRTRVGVRVEPAPGARVFLQAQDSRVLGAESSTSATARAADVMELHQGYLELSMPRHALVLAARVGRQEIALGNERLVGAVNWSNLSRAFDGVRVTAAARGTTPGSEQWSSTAFAAVVDERGRHFGPTSLPGTASDDHVVAALYATGVLSGGAVVDATAMYDAGARYRAYVASDRRTIDGRVRLPRVFGAPIRVELEGAYQTGQQHYVAAGDTSGGRAQEIVAWLASARVGTALRPGGAALTIGADVLSGDAAPGDARYSAFGTMYATNHPFYGLMDVIGDPAASTQERGLVDALAAAALPLRAPTLLRAELHRFALATGRDRVLGWESDIVLPMRLGPTATMDLGYALFRAGSGAKAVGLGATGSIRHWTYLQLGVSF